MNNILNIFQAVKRKRNINDIKTDQQKSLTTNGKCESLTQCGTRQNKKQSRKKSYGCVDCEKAFISPYHLMMHFRTHTKEKPLNCTFCGKAFSLRSNLKKHTMVHTGEYSHRCDICSKGFCSAFALKRHTRSHSGERPFRCSTCNKGFFDLSTLKGHMKIHSTEKLFCCKQCGKGFKHNSHLVSHTRPHIRAFVRILVISAIKPFAGLLIAINIVEPILGRHPTVASSVEKRLRTAPS